METSNVKIDEGSTTALATYSITEDAITKQLSRSSVVDSSGAEISLATSGNQESQLALADVANTWLSGIDVKTPALGQALAAASTPVVLTAAQVATLTPPAAITNFANETGGNLASIKTNTDKIPAQGQAAMAASLPVVLANNQSDVPTNLKAATTGGWTPYQLISAATTNATTVKASAGQVGYIICSNINAAARYIKLYNSASAPTVGSDTPVFTEVLPGSSTGGGIALNIPAGISFSNGISFALTTGMAVADTGAVASAEISVNIGYK